MWQFSWKSEKKIFDPFCKTFLTDGGKNKDEDKNIWKKTSSSFEFSISILGYLWKGLILSHKGNWWNKTNFCFLEFKKAFNDTQEVVKCLAFIPNFDKSFKTHRKTPLTSNPLSKDLWIAWVAHKSWLMSQPSLKPDWFLEIRLLSIRYLFI